MPSRLSFAFPAGDLGGQLDTLDALFDFQPAFRRAVRQVTSPESNTRQAMHELVCTMATRLHVERVILLPLLAGHPDAADYDRHAPGDHHRIEVLLALIDRRAGSDPNLPSMFEELQQVTWANITHQQPAASLVRAGLSDEQADRLRCDLQAAVDTAMTRPHPNLPRHGPLGQLTTTMTARFDRLRNHAPLR